MNDDLRARGLTTAGSVRRYYDVGGGVGGPIMRDKLWFFSAARWEDRSSYQAGNYYNKRQGTVFYEPDLSRPAYNHDFSKDASVRFTWQAAAKHKIVGNYTHHPSCQCTFALLEQVSPIFAPEAVAEHHYDGHGPGQKPQSLTTAHYTYPVTNRLLIEADLSVSVYHRDQTRVPGVGYDAISVTDTGLNLRYGSRSTLYQVLNDDRKHERFAVSYITGTHNFKAGVDLNQFSQGRKSYDDPFLVNQAISYTFRQPAAGVGLDLHGAIRAVSDGNGECVLRAGSVDHAEADAEPGRAVRRVRCVDPGIPPAGGPVRACARFPGSQALAPLGKSQPAGGRRLRPVWHRQDGAQGGAGPVSSPQHGRRREPPRVESAHEHDDELERLPNGNFVPDCDLRNRRGQRRVRSVE